MRKIKTLFIALLLPTILFAQNLDIEILKEVNLNRNTLMDGILRGFTNAAAPITFGIQVVLFGICYLKKIH
jgi:hypothetical protein